VENGVEGALLRILFYFLHSRVILAQKLCFMCPILYRALFTQSLSINFLKHCLFKEIFAVQRII